MIGKINGCNALAIEVRVNRDFWCYCDTLVEAKAELARRTCPKGNVVINIPVKGGTGEVVTLFGRNTDLDGQPDVFIVRSNLE